MTTEPDGTVICDHCGADLGNGAVTVAATLLVLDTFWEPQNLHLGLSCCTLLRDHLADLVWRQTSPESPGPVMAYVPSDTVNMTPTTVSTTEGNTPP